MRSVAGSGLLLAGLFLAFIAALAPAEGASAASPHPGPPAARRSGPTAPGELLFRTKGCAACHSLSAQGHRVYVGGPDLSGIDFTSRRPGLTAAAYIAESVREPGAFLAPGATGTFEMPVLGLTDAEIDAIARFLLRR